LLFPHDFNGEIMFKNEEKIIRCKCGNEVVNLRTLSDGKTGAGFLTGRCIGCGEVAVILACQQRGSSQ
jgi:hypothetical protein